MNRFYFRLLSTLGLLVAGQAQAAQFKFSNQILTVPDGFEIEQIAGPPLVERPISGSFDEQGRLYVTDSSGSNDKVEKQAIEKPHRVRRLEPADTGGHFVKGTLFAEHLMFPEGCLWFNDSLYVSAPPSIWKFSNDGKGGAESRSEWHEGKTLTGCANDLHGPYLGLDGWIYWCKGAFALQSYDRPGRKPLVTRASHIFRAPPDHTELEPVLTAGMDNPVGVVFDLSGERFMCGTFLMHPEAGKRDGIVHAIYGGVYGKSNDVLDGHPRTGDLMPIMTHLGAAAPCSVIRYESDSFGAEYRNNLFVCCFNLHKVTRHILEPDGATFETVDSDFVVSDNTDFHPTDVIEDADGSLIVIDTGGWYKLCCPTSQLSKPDVLGAIYRVRRKDGRPILDPRGLNVTWDKLDAKGAAQLLGDKRAAVRKRALLSLGRIGVSAVPELLPILKAAAPETRANAIWALTRITGQPARDAVRTSLEDPVELVQHAAIHSVALWRDRGAAQQLEALLTSSNPQLQRAAAEALGRIGDSSAIPALLEAASQQRDRVLEHSLCYALIEIGDSAATARALNTQNTNQQCLALIALDQMEKGGLKAQTVTPLLSSPNRPLRETAIWICDHHPDWGTALGGYFETRLKVGDSAPSEREELKRQLVVFAQTRPIEQIIGSRLTENQTPVGVRELLLGVIALSAPTEAPPSWIRGVRVTLGQHEEPLLRVAIRAAKVLNESKTPNLELAGPLLQVAQDGSHPEDLRLAALAALPPNQRALDPELVSLLLANVDPAKPVLIRGVASEVLAKSKLTEDELVSLADRLRTATPLETTKLLESFEQSTNEVVGTKLMDALQGSKSLASLRPDALQKLLAQYPPQVQDRGKALLALMQVDTAKQSAHLDELMQSLGGGDIRRGQTVFNSQKAACSSCHAMGYLGGHVGPDLTSIGQVRTERDLLESIVYPSASFVRSFEPYVVRTREDDEYSGVLRKDTPDEVILATGPSTEVRIARAEIADMRPGKISVMPAGLDQQLTRQELADLVTFLKATKWGAH